ncbi:hypothetical protein AgCh_024495 [Apium graveolens]
MYHLFSVFENFTYRAVLEAVGFCLTNKYCGGLPRKRYCGGNEYIDELKILFQERALAALHLDGEKWGVNVQPLSSSPENFEVYASILRPHDRQMRCVSGTSVYFKSMLYRLNKSIGLVDYDMLEKTANLFRPKLIIAGVNAYPRDFDYPHDVGAFLMMNIAHISGLVASVVADTFEYCDIVSTTTHKNLLSTILISQVYRVVLITTQLGTCSLPEVCADPEIQGLPKSEEIISQNEVSRTSLVHFWSLWKENIEKLFEYLGSLESQELSNFPDHGEFCFNYFEARRKCYWKSEILSVGMKLMQTLEALLNL